VPSLILKKKEKETKIKQKNGKKEKLNTAVTSSNGKNVLV